MVQNPLMITAIGGLILTLTSVSCASRAHDRTTADTGHRDRVAASDRVGNTDRMSGSEGARMGDERTGITERPVPSNRTGTGEPMAKDRMIPCADQKGDMTASMECAPAGSQHRDRDGRQVNAAAMANCKHHTDDRGRIIYDDQSCAKRYSQQGSSYENVDWTQESAFFDRHVGKAAQHAREAEIAANQGHQVEMRHHAELALERAKEAQRAGNVPALNNGIQDLRDALRYGDTAGAADPVRHIHDARVNLARAGHMKLPADMRAATAAGGSQAGAASRMSRTVKGELIAQDAAATSDGGRRYLLREQNGRETPITLGPDMNQNVQSGEMVEAQVDSQGRVASINKAAD